METESAAQTATIVKVITPEVSAVNEDKGEETDGQVVIQVKAEDKVPEKDLSILDKSKNLEAPEDSNNQVSTIIGEDEDGEAIDMADIRVLDDLDTENKSPVKEEVVPNKTVKVEDKEEEEDKKDAAAKKKKSFEFFYPDMVSTLELALRGLPSMANCQEAKASIPQKGPPPKGPLQKGSVQKRPAPIRDFAKEAKKALKKSGNIIEVRATRKSTRTAAIVNKQVNSTNSIVTTKEVSPTAKIVSPQTKTVSPVKHDQPIIVLDRVNIAEHKDVKQEPSPEPVAKKARNTPKAAGKKSKVMPQAVVKQGAETVQKVETKLIPVQATAPKAKVASSKVDPETYVVVPGGRHTVIKYPPVQSSAAFRQPVSRLREWRKKGMGRISRPKGGGGLIIDNQKEIPTMMMKMRVSDTSDIVTSLDLAPPTKRLMQLRETEGSKESSKLFSIPGRHITPRLAWSLFYPNLTTKPKGDDSDSDEDDKVEDMAAEEEDPNNKKKCFTIIRSEPLDQSDSEDNIHYTNVLSDDDDENVAPVYESESTPANVPAKIKAEQTDAGTVSTDTNKESTGLIQETTTDSNNQQDISASTDGQSLVVKQETSSSVSETATLQTVPASDAPLVVQGEVTMVDYTAPIQQIVSVSDNPGSSPALARTEMDTSVVDISLTSVSAGEVLTDTVSVNQMATTSGHSVGEEGCVILSVVTEIAEPYVERDGEIVRAEVANNSEDTYVVYVEK